MEQSKSRRLTNFLRRRFGRLFSFHLHLYGIARVRPKLHEWENVVQLTEAFGKPELTLEPIQLPYTATEKMWLAIGFPETEQLDKMGDRLLYTAHYNTPFSKNSPQCGLLLDEWTEVIPTKEETAGLTFHYDRPNNEPPQTLLLVTPASVSENWQWEDLVDGLTETFIMAKRRAVEPKNIEPTTLARFLPATLAAVTRNRISMSANFGVNNRYHEKIKP